MPLSVAGCLFKSMRNAAVGIITIQKAAESLFKHARLDAFRKQGASRRKPQKWIFFSFFCKGPSNVSADILKSQQVFFFPVFF